MTSLRRSASATLDLRLDLAEQLGWRCTCLDPDTAWLWRVERGSRALILAGSLSPLNDAVAARVSADKFHCATVLRGVGVAVPATARCLRPGAYPSVDPSQPDRFAEQRGVDPAVRFADLHGYPLVVKPNRGSRGRAVARVDDRPALDHAIAAVWELDELALVQPALPGLDLRVDLLDGELLLAYLRRPLRLLGDGCSTVLALTQRADPRSATPGVLAKLRTEPLWTTPLAAAGLTEASVLAPDQALEFPSTVLNLNRCCTVELFDQLPGPWLGLAQRIAAAVGLRHCGLDLRIPVRRRSARWGIRPRRSCSRPTPRPGVAQIHALGSRGAALAEAGERRVLEAMFEGR